MRIKISPPASEEYDAFFEGYIQLAQTENLLDALSANLVIIINLMLELEEEQLLHRYAPGKWSIKEVLVHMMDVERIFAYRALRFARQDKIELPGFDENAYVAPAKADTRTITGILAEYEAVRHATIEFFRNLDEEALNQVGTGSGKQVSVRALGYSILGHELHHLNIIRQRYLLQSN